eukprot:3841199-Rhodomonas_salina.1
MEPRMFCSSTMTPRTSQTSSTTCQCPRAIHREIKYKKPPFQYNLYRECEHTAVYTRMQNSARPEAQQHATDESERGDDTQ